MPELPEVETICRDLSRVLISRLVVNIEVKKLGLLRNPLATFKRYLVGATILSINRRAKLILIKLSSQYVLAIHLKMTGQLVWKSPKGGLKVGGHPIINTYDVPNKFTYIIVCLSDGSKLYFNDIRQFGYWQLIKSDELNSHLRHYGPEPLGVAFTFEVFNSNLHKHNKAPIKTILLNQTVVAGLGNIYVDECLYVSKVRPTRRVGSLKENEIKNIYKAIKQVLSKAVKARGTSFNTYVDALGKSGSYWNKRLVYGRSGEKCRICAQIIKKITVSGRGTHYCANCQH